MGARAEAGALRELSVTPQTSLAFVGAPVKLAIRYTNRRIGIIGIETNKTFALPSRQVADRTCAGRTRWAIWSALHERENSAL